MDIVCIHSYKGGAGKTTIALNLSAQLSRSGKKVLLIESDFKMPSFYEIFKKLHIDTYYNSFFKESQQSKVGLQSIIHPTDITNLDVIIANPEFNPEEKIHTWDKRWHAFHLRRLREALIALKRKNLYDFIIFDTPPGLSFVALNNIALAHHGVIVVRPNSHAIDGTRRMIKDFYFKTKSPDKINLYLLFNQIPRVKMTHELDEWSLEFKAMKLKPAGRIPCSCEGTYAMAKGKHIFPNDHEINRFMSPLVSFLKNEEEIIIPDPTTNF